MSEEQESEAARLVGRMLANKYNLVKLLGEGGMGAVYLGEQRLGDATKQVAIKVLHKSLLDDPQEGPKMRARFERECGIVAQLHHPNTIQVFDFGTADDGSLFIVMEFVEGRSLATILEQGGPLPPERVERILSQIVGSLEEAHAHGIIHRDLKPDNIVLCERPGQKDWVEVLDFGIAKRSGEEDPRAQKLTQMGMVLGTPPYMSPEQFTGQPIDARSDIYSLGVMVFEMLTGRLPFSGHTAYEWATQHMTAQPLSLDATPMGARIPPAIKAAIQRALEKQPERRFASVREFMEAFSARAPIGVNPPPGPSAPYGTGDAMRPGGTQMAAAVTPPPVSPMAGMSPMAGPGYASAPPPYGAGAQGYGAPPGPPVQGAGYPTPGGVAYPPPPSGQPHSGARPSGGKGALVAGLVIVGLGGAGVAIAAGLGVFSGKSNVVATAVPETPTVLPLATTPAVVPTTPQPTQTQALTALPTRTSTPTTHTTPGKPSATTTAPTATATTTAVIPPPPPPPTVTTPPPPHRP